MDNLENQEIQDNEDFSEAQVPLQKEKKEVRLPKESGQRAEPSKKPRSEKQLAHFANMAEKRKQNIEKKKLEKKIEASKLLLEHDIKPKAIEQKKVEQEVEEEEVVTPSEEEEEESEKEEIIVKKKPKAKTSNKKKKKIIIYEADSDSSDSDDDIPIPPKAFKTQRNKKSQPIIKVYQNENEVVNKKPTKINYFAD